MSRLEEVLYKWLKFPPDTQDRQYELQSLHHEATGRWLLRDDQFVRWKDTPGALWIKGFSGTGKSVLSSTVIEEMIKTCPQSTVVYFYFDFRNERQRMDSMLRSIVWQLSGRSPFPYRSLCQLHKTLGNGTLLPQHIDLLGVLTDLLSELDQTYIVIDGLDECNKTDWKPLVELIHNLCHPAKNAPHLLFTSQPLEEFQKGFKDAPFIELGSWVSNDDIRSFIGSEVPRLENWASEGEYTKDVTEQIVYKSNGMFRMAACLLIELENCYEDDRFLTRAKASLKPAFIQAIFRWLVFSARQITSDELADAISFPLDARGFDFSDPAKSTYYPKRRQDNSNKLKLLEGLIVIKNNGSDERNSAQSLTSQKMSPTNLLPKLVSAISSFLQMPNI
ncbi:hypothetical protein B0H11DRAFT_450410 [Mycena galericulata]|nr:hypothetical protein B0H11DRAFT_450410 [Mycena galericulata]